MSVVNDATSENPRAIRGAEIAERFRVRQDGDSWIVPSQSGDGRYRVYPDEQRCTCPDHSTRQLRCKHLFAVEYTIERQSHPDGTETVTEAVRVTYSQDWSSYNAAQVEEGPRFRALLSDLCGLIEQPEQCRGRPRLSLADMTFASVMKVYTGFSSRRFIGALGDAQQDGYIERVPHFNSVSNYLASPDLTPILHDLITVSALPLRAVESHFAVDSSGFSTSTYVRWYAKQHERVLDNKEWVKAHIMVGTATGVVTSVEITDWKQNDNPHLIPLMHDTARNFDVREVSADKAYVGRANLTAIEEIGAAPLIPFKANSVVTRRDEGTAWQRAYFLFAYHREEFLSRYHQRSNVESTFGAIKAKFGPAVRSKSRTGQVNEVLAKVLAHNITVLIRAMLEPAYNRTSGLSRSSAPPIRLSDRTRIPSARYCVAERRCKSMPGGRGEASGVPTDAEPLP